MIVGIVRLVLIQRDLVIIRCVTVMYVMSPYKLGG